MHDVVLNMKKFFLSVVFLGLINMHLTPAYSDDMISSITQLAFTYIYYTVGATPCHEITADGNSGKAEDNISWMFSLIESNGIKLDGLNKEYVLKKLYDAKMYCMAFPNATFGDALIKTSGINFPLDNNYSQHNRSNSKSAINENQQGERELTSTEKDKHRYNIQKNENLPSSSSGENTEIRILD